MAQGEILAVIGGSGLYDIPGLQDVEPVAVETPYGAPSDAIIRGRIGEQKLLFLPRHGRGHRLAPHVIPYRANICALKMLGATQVLSVSAVGSMKEGIAPGDLVVVDQFIDMTKRRVSSFFDGGATAHVSFADPVCEQLADAVHEVAAAVLADVPETERPKLHRGGTYVCMEGPQFSTRAESRLYRQWGVDVIGMTNLPEAKLAREAELPYATLALATDYDCWHESEEDVDVSAIIALLQKMVSEARDIVVRLVDALPDHRQSPAASALDNCVMTRWNDMAVEAQTELSWLLGPQGPRRER